MTIFNLNGHVIYESTAKSICEAVEEAVHNNVSLKRADLQDADLHRANLRKAYLWGANLSGAVLCGTDLQDANLQDVNLQGTNLEDTNLQGANLWWAKGITVFSGVGEYHRTCFAVHHGDHCKIQIGCFWGTQEEAQQVIRKKYGKNSTYEKFMNAACDVLMEKAA